MVKSLIYTALVASVAALALVGLIWVTKQITAKSSETSYPTAIPGIDNEVECKNTRRSWRENQCWDNEWNHNF